MQHQAVRGFLSLSGFSHLHRFPSQDEEVLRSHHHEAHELVAQDLLDLVRLVETSELVLGFKHRAEAHTDWLQVCYRKSLKIPRRFLP